MIYDSGVRGQRLSDAVIALHTSLNHSCRDASLGELLSTRHLLRCAELCKQQLDLGIAMETALNDAALDVYVRSMHDRFVAKVRKSMLYELTPARHEQYCIKSLIRQWSCVDDDLNYCVSTEKQSQS